MTLYWLARAVDTINIKQMKTDQGDMFDIERHQGTSREKV